jgi:hypothetical protein
MKMTTKCKLNKSIITILERDKTKQRQMIRCVLFTQFLAFQRNRKIHGLLYTLTRKEWGDCAYGRIPRSEGSNCLMTEVVRKNRYTVEKERRGFNGGELGVLLVVVAWVVDRLLVGVQLVAL